MTFQTLGWISAGLFLFAAVGWFLAIERERRSPERLSKDERLRRELQENLERVRGIVR